MVSQRRNPRSARQSANAVSDDVILDATYHLLLAVGLRRMTMADIARHADVSRATLYRRWQNVREVVAALLTREWSTAIDVTVDATSDAANGRQRLIDVVVRTAHMSRTHPLLRKIIELDPEFLMPYLLHRRGANTDHQLALLEKAVGNGIADGSIRTGDAAELARSVLLVAWSSALTGPVLTDDFDSLDDHLRDLLERYLTP